MTLDTAQWDVEAADLAESVCASIAKTVDKITLLSVSPDEASATNSLDKDFLESLLAGKHLSSNYLSGV